MRATVVYESMFGNTREIAEAIAEGLSAYGRVTVTEVGAANSTVPAGTDLLVVGGPTHVLGLSRPGTRDEAARRRGTPPVSPGIGIREWLDRAPRAIPGTTAAAFDTKIAKSFAGSAARGVEKRLRHLGYDIWAHAQSFLVTDTAGPLYAGELDRARWWGAELGARTVRRGVSPAAR